MPLRRRVVVALGAFAIGYCVLQVEGFTQKSATWDEPVHLATGYLAVAKGDYRLEATHPPLMRMWAALPLRFMRGIHADTSVIDRTPPATWHSGLSNVFATKFLYLDNDADRLLNAARFMIVLCGLGLGVLVFCWAHEWLGYAAAVFALLFYSLSPNLLAHASLVTTDAGITCFIFGSVYFLWRASRSFSPGNVAGVAICTSAAIVTKFSALILGPIIATLLLVSVLRRTEITARRAALLAGVISLASYGAIWAVYGFRYEPSATSAWVLHLEGMPLAQTVPGIARVTRWIDVHRLLPNMFTEGFLMFAQSMRPPNYTFLAGAYSPSGWWYYFPVAFLIKTPIALLTVIAFGFGVVARQRQASSGLLFVCLPIAIYLLPALLSTYQVGLRHILPIYPFLMLIAGAAASTMVRRRPGRIVLAGLVVAQVVVLAMVYPHTLTFFNRFVGGPRQGYHYLADSNLDWGQGLKQLKRWMDRNRVSHVGLAYFGSADPAYYGIDYTQLPAANPGFVAPWERPWGRPPLPGYVAVSATVLSGVYLDARWRHFYGALRERAPEAVVGNSIFVYWLDRWPELAEAQAEGDGGSVDRQLADELAKAQWFDHAAVHYRQHVARHPDDLPALVNLGATLLASGDHREAIAVLERSLAIAPDTGLAHFVLAQALFDTRSNIDEVLLHARRASQLMPGDVDVLVLLARGLAVHGELNEAGITVRRALALKPDDEGAHDLFQRITAAAVSSP